ncbi:MAG: sulfotransferase domain-containing protein [Chloroflexota bacterium]|nr:sulfotransferase domain-containing protein [Chloroflexota bacterium]
MSITELAPYKILLKHLRHRARRTMAALRHGHKLKRSPILFANSFPKSGTHLLTQVLQGLTRISPAVDSGLPAILTFDGPTGQPRPLDDILADLRRLRPGDVAYGHLHALPAVTAELTHEGTATFFIYRDPRDVVVSHVHYVTEMQTDHVHHQYYAEELQNFDERLTTSILGRPGLDVPFPDIRARFEPYLGWLDRSEVLALRYEDFIMSRDETLLRVLNHARARGLVITLEQNQTLQVLESAINPAQSPTFRSGKVGKWRQSFTAEHKSLFKAITGDLLIRLGYEDSDDW